MPVDQGLEAAHVERPSRRSLSFVWLVPVFAALIGGAVAWQSLSEQGPLVEILFEEASGIEAGATEIRHNDVVVGIVEDVSLTPDLSAVSVRARMDKIIAPYLGETAQFWVVSARFDGAAISGLSTILSGAYIEVDWSEPSDDTQRVFEGLSRPPLTPPGSPGRHVTLRAQSAGSVGVGSPIYFRQLEVGRVEERTLAEDGRSIMYRGFIEAPYHERINAATRFWNASGVDIRAGADGFVVRVESMQALLAGGLAFGSVGEGSIGGEVAADRVFRIFRDRDDAVESLYVDEENSFRFIAEFDGSISGLQPGAAIEFDGLRVGVVDDIVFEFGSPGPEDDRVYAVLSFQPSRIGNANVSEAELRANFDAMVAGGMRLRLSVGNILTGAAVIELVQIDDAEPAAIDYDAVPYPALPTAPSTVEAVTQNAQTLIANLSALPLEDLVLAATDLLRSADAVVGNPSMEAAPEELLASLRAFSEVARSVDAATDSVPALLARLSAVSDAANATLDGLSPDSEVYVELSAAVRDLRDAARSIAELAELLEREPNALLVGR